MTILDQEVLLDSHSIYLVRGLCKLSSTLSNDNCHLASAIKVAHDLEDKSIVTKMTKFVDLSGLAKIFFQIFGMTFIA